LVPMSIKATGRASALVNRVLLRQLTQSVAVVFLLILEENAQKFEQVGGRQDAHHLCGTGWCIKDASSIAVLPRNSDSSGGALPALALTLAG
jgi:hypothetical protein